jgi:hypothetical protein
VVTNLSKAAAVPFFRRPLLEALEDRRLFAASLAVDQSMLVFNAVRNAAASPVETVTLTDTGDAALTIGSGSINVTDDQSSPTHDSARFTIVNATSVPASLSPGQSFALQLDYSAIAAGINSAFLNISSNDPAHPMQQVALRGIGTAGLGGSNQPSLTRILRAYEIPTNVGEAETATVYPNPPGAGSQEVPLQRLVKAGAGPVTIQVLASFTATLPHPYTLGFYTPGDPTHLHQLFFTPDSESQTVFVHPQGATSFDPGSASFGFYFVSNVQVKGRIGYSEDSLNTWDSTNNRKFRFFPMENKDGSAVPNAYIMTSTEWNAPAGYDFTNIVAIVRNVKAALGAPHGAVLGLQNMDGLPASDRLIFNRIQQQNTKIGDLMHDTDVLRIHNTGDQPLVISSYALSSAAWTLVNPAVLPWTVAAGGFLDLTIKFVAQSEPSHPYNETNATFYPNGGGVYNGTLTLSSNDPQTPTRVVTLAGYWQAQSESAKEPALQTIINLLAGWGTNINSKPTPTLPEPTTAAQYYGEEVVSAYWSVADPALQVSVHQLNSWHTQGNSATLSWYDKSTKFVHGLFTTTPDAGQMLFPYANGTTTPAAANFTPTATFGFKIDGEWSDDSLNQYRTGGGHHIRFYPLRDGSGNLVPNTYIMTLDYGSVPNYDFQDNTYIISNIRPAATPPAPTDLYAVGMPGGVQLQWAPLPYANLKGFNIYRSLSPTSGFTLIGSTSVPAVQQSFFDSSAPARTVAYYRVTAVDSVTAVESLGATASAVAGATTRVLASVDIGASPAGSTTVVTPGTDYSVTAGGPGVTGTSDGFRFLYQQWTGDFDVKVQVQSITVAGNFSTAGIMARSTLDANSAEVYMSASPVNYRFKSRATTGAATTIAASGTTSYPNVWVRLKRVGNVFSGYTSTDGIHWTLMSSVTLNLPGTLDLGLAVASNVSTATTTAQLRNYSNT